MSKIRQRFGRTSSKPRRIGLIIVAIMMFGTQFGQPVSAVSNVSPDPSDYSTDGSTPSNRIQMVVSEGGGTGLDAKTSKVYAYAPVSDGATVHIQILGADHCRDGNSGTSGVDSSNPSQTGGFDTTFTISNQTGFSTSRNNSIRLVSTYEETNLVGCNTDVWDFFIPVSDGDRPSVGTGLNAYYKLEINAEMFNNGVNAFVVRMPSGGGIVSFADNSGQKFSLQQRIDRNAFSRSIYNLYFATPCDAGNGAVNKSLLWFDADQNNYGQFPSNFGYKLYQRARGSGAGWTQIAQNTNVGGEGLPDPGSVPSYDFYRSQEYLWQWYGVSANNGIQFQVPFNSAYYAVGCDGVDFALTPTISTSPSIVSPATTQIDVTATVGKSGSSSSFSDEEWRVTKFIVPSGSSLSLGGSPDQPCNQYSGESSCSTVWSATNQQFTNASTTIVNNQGDGVDQALQPGTMICYVASVSRGSTAAPSWLHSAPSCSTVLQIPFTYILGSDLRVGSGFSIAQNSLARIGSYVTSKGGTWAEYGVLAPYLVDGVASQSGAVNGSSASQSAWSKLTFANTGVGGGCSPAYGCFVTNPQGMGTIPNVSNFLTSSTLTGVEQRNKAGANVSINSEFVSGIYDPNNFRASVVLYTTGTVTIDRDIKYNTGTLTDGSQIPQLVIIAGNINIQSNVGQVDAWLVSTGTVNTCSDVAQANLRSTNCDSPLRVNGPVMASRLLLDRTYYDQTKANAAEKVNLRGDAYVWANQVSRANADWQTTYTTDLPPRY